MPSMGKTRKSFLTAFAALALLAPLTLSTLPAQSASFRPPRSAFGQVVSTSKIANAIGLEVLKKGGNAIDAAVAVGYALAVVHPVAGNLGGGGFAVIHLKDGTDATLDFRETAPGKARRDMFLDEKGEVVKDKSVDGHLAAGVPGTVAGLSAMLDRYGELPLSELIEPSIEFAEKGYSINVRQAETFQEYAPRLKKFPATRKYFFKKDGTPYREGEKLVQKDLAKTLRLISQQGPDAFYQGKIADLIERDMAKNGGIITREDLKKYRPLWRSPVKGSYRGYEIVSMGPPSSGGTHLIEMLNILEGYPLASYGHNSAQSVHFLTEAMRRAYADRSEYMGDPDFVKIPLKNLLSKEYAARLRCGIEAEKATSSKNLPGNVLHEGNNTTHFSVADHEGNAVSITTTLNDYYGAKAAVDGAGFFLNDEMDDFSVKPGVPNNYGLVGGDANAIAPYKRPLSSMSPSIVLKNKKLFMVVGSPGGARIITTVLQVVLNVIDHGMNIQEAVDAPRIHHQWLPDELRIEKRGLSRDTLELLKERGHEVVVRSPMGDVNAILIDQGIMDGAGDPRNEF